MLKEIIVNSVRKIEFQMPLSPRNGIILLGVFHGACLITIILVPALNRGIAFESVYANMKWPMRIILANALVAIGVTAPLSKRRPSLKLRSLWLLWVFAAYYIVSTLSRDIDFTHWRIGPLAPFALMPESPMKLFAGDILFAIGCLIIAALIVGGLRQERLTFLGWRIWLILSVLAFLSMWNTECLLVPSYMLAGLGCYIAYSSLGREWLWRGIIGAIFVTIIPCIRVISCSLTQNFSADLPQTALAPRITPLNIMEWGRRFPGELCGSIPLQTARWLISLSPLTVAAMFVCRRWPRILLVLVASIQIAALIFTGRRSAYLALVVMIPVGLIFTRRLRFIAKLLIISSILLLIVILNEAGVFSLREFFLESGSNRDHYMFALAALDMFRHSPLVGVGFGWYNAHGIPWGEAHRYDISPSLSAHNDYLNLLSEGGLIGFFLAIGVAVQLFLAFRRILIKSNWLPARFLVLALSTECIALAISFSFTAGVFLRAYWIFPNVALIAALFGAVWVEERLPT